MPVFHVTFQCRPGMRDEFLEKIKAAGIIAASRAEPGNLRYDYSVPVDHADALYLIEQYRDDAAVGEHVRQAHTAQLVALKETYVTDLILERYEKA